MNQEEIDQHLDEVGPILDPTDCCHSAQPERPYAGGIVHFVLPDGPNRGQCRAAMITSTWDHSPSNLRLYRDQAEDTPMGVSVESLPELRLPLVRHDEESQTPGTWHWPRTCKSCCGASTCAAV
jgi:hypothetical protein